MAAGFHWQAVADSQSVMTGQTSTPSQGYLAPGGVGGMGDAAALDDLRMTSDTRLVGPELIDGVETSYYSGTIAPARLPQHTDEALAGLSDLNVDMRTFEDHPPRVEAWVDSSGYLRRFRLTETYNDSALGSSTTVDLDDFGQGS